MSSQLTATTGVDDWKPLVASAARPNGIEIQLWRFLQWYTSFFYWGFGVLGGLTRGYVYLVTTYFAQLLVDTFRVFGIRVPDFLERTAAGRGVQSAVPIQTKGTPKQALRQDEKQPRMAPPPHKAPTPPHVPTIVPTPTPSKSVPSVAPVGYRGASTAVM